MKAQINISEENEARLIDLQLLLALNDIRLGNKELLINKVIHLSFDLINSLDEDSLEKILGLKKTW